MKMLARGSLRMIRTTFAEDERLEKVKAFDSDLILRYSLDKNGYSILWFEDEGTRLSWILSYSREIHHND